MAQQLLQKEVAALIGVTADTILNWETAKTEPEVRHLPKMLDFLGYCPCEPKRRTAGERLKLTRRYLLGVSQEELAARLGVDEGTVWQWEEASAPSSGHSFVHRLEAFMLGIAGAHRSDP